MFAEASDIEVEPVLAVLKARPADGQDRRDHETLPEVGRAEAVERFSKDCKLVSSTLRARRGE